jgi:hypothetical protein
MFAVELSKGSATTKTVHITKKILAQIEKLLDSMHNDVREKYDELES